MTRIEQIYSDFFEHKLHKSYAFTQIYFRFGSIGILPMINFNGWKPLHPKPAFGSIPKSPP